MKFRSPYVSKKQASDVFAVSDRSHPVSMSIHYHQEISTRLAALECTAVTRIRHPGQRRHCLSSVRRKVIGEHDGVQEERKRKQSRSVHIQDVKDVNPAFGVPSVDAPIPALPQKYAPEFPALSNRVIQESFSSMQRWNVPDFRAQHAFPGYRLSVEGGIQ